MFKRVALTSLRKPSASLIKSICFPNMHQVMTKEMQYGLSSEPLARVNYCDIAKSKHTYFELCEQGLCLNNEYPHILASPDGYIWCMCCGYGVLEIKCPYRAKDEMSNYLNCKDAAVCSDDMAYG